MPDGGVFCIVAPPNPYRGATVPYERASLVAHYLLRSKPKAKILILDAKDKFAKQGLFMSAWKDRYGDMIEWVSGPGGGLVDTVHAKGKRLMAGGAEIKGDVINLIPPQKAGAIAERAGLVDDSGWCPVDQRTFESTIHKNVYVIGDACIAGAMPKTGYAANCQGKVCAAAIVAALNGESVPEPVLLSTGYSIVAPDYGISVAGVYQLRDGKIVEVPGAGGLSPPDADARTRAIEAHFARSWLTNISSDMFT